MKEPTTTTTSKHNTPPTPPPPPLLSWNHVQVYNELKSAAVELKSRGLPIAAKFATEQLMGMDATKLATNYSTATTTTNNNNNNSNGSPSPAKNEMHTPKKKMFTNSDDFLMTTPTSQRDEPPQPTHHHHCRQEEVAMYEIEVLHAQVLLDAGEFERAAAVLSDDRMNEVNGGRSHHGSPVKGLGSRGIFIRGYAMYLAGERRKEEELLEIRGTLGGFSVNPNLPQLVSELAKFCTDGELDAFGMYLYGVVLKALHRQSCQTAKISNSVLGETRTQHYKEALNAFIDSILMFPNNWSAWRDLADLCLENSSVHSEVERRLESFVDHFMYHFFLIHNFMELQDNEQALVLIEGLEGLFPHSSFLQSQTATAFYNMRDFDAAQDHFTNLRGSDPFRLDDMETYSNILYVKEYKAELSRLAHSVARTDKYRPESCCIIGNYYALKGQHEKAAQYFERALKIDPSFLSAWTLMGHEYIELKNTAAAIEAYRKAVDINPREYRAWYGLGQTYEILNMLHFSLKYYRKAATLRPFDARIWCAIGGCYLSLNKRSEAIRCYERGIENNDIEGVATEQLAKLYRDGAEFDKAARCYRAILSMHQSSDISERVAEALLFLAHYYKDNKNYEVASICCSRLFEYPGQEKEEAKALLREIRSRTDADRQDEKEDSFNHSMVFSP